MATITYAYTPGTVVWVITPCGVKKGTIVDFHAVVTTSTVAAYMVQVEGISTPQSYVEASIFANIPSAVAAYTLLITP